MHSGYWWGVLRERTTWKSRRRWDDNIKLYIQEMGWGGMDWIDLAKERDRWRSVMNGVMNLLFT
jgi:hypothetical protein